MKVVLIILGFISMGIGIVGIVVPILPTTPFLLLASFFFAKGSKRFHDWFISTKIYKKYLESFVKSKAMTLKNKFTILFPVSCMLIITFIFVNNLYARIVLIILFIGKYLYFFTQIKTIAKEEREIKKNGEIAKENNNIE
ncbi:YbaN family protein [uncultured Brachyspira sp.]|uniref:YbaN family protein n=1 Tax=uncultured Brachyspira sp. TaxID=221953 RepID=UPI0025978D78|nr:YbaN family protein [uncultured Brachyspira sp.]